MTEAEIMNETPNPGGVYRVGLLVYEAKEDGEFDLINKKLIIYNLKTNKIEKEEYAQRQMYFMGKIYTIEHEKPKINLAKYIEEIYSTSIPYHFQVFKYGPYYLLYEEYSGQIKKIPKQKIYTFLKKEGIEVGPYNVWVHLPEKIKKICKEGYAGIYYIPKEKINRKNWEQLFWRYASKEFKAYVFASLFKE